MPRYLVRWEIDIEAEDEVSAARAALAIQRNPESCATVFDVDDEDGFSTHIDLELVDQEENHAAA